MLSPQFHKPSQFREERLHFDNGKHQLDFNQQTPAICEDDLSVNQQIGELQDAMDAKCFAVLEQAIEHLDFVCGMPGRLPPRGIRAESCSIFAAFLSLSVALMTWLISWEIVFTLVHSPVHGAVLSRVANPPPSNLEHVGLVLGNAG